MCYCYHFGIHILEVYRVIVVCLNRLQVSILHKRNVDASLRPYVLHKYKVLKVNIIIGMLTKFIWHPKQGVLIRINYLLSFLVKIDFIKFRQQ